jgi:hypothetical protein
MAQNEVLWQYCVSTGFSEFLGGGKGVGWQVNPDPATIAGL